MNLSEKELRRANSLLTVLAVVAAGFLLLALRGVLLPLAIAFFLSYLGMPVIRAGRRIKIPVSLLVLLVIAMFATGIGAVGLIFYTSTDQFIQELPRYEGRLIEIGNRILKLPELEKYVEKVEQGETPEELKARLEEEAKDRGDEEGGKPGEEPGGKKEEEQQPPPTPKQEPETPEPEEQPSDRPQLEREISWGKVLRSGGLVDVAGEVVGGFGNALLVLVFLIFILLDRGRGSLDDRIVHAFSREGEDSARAPLMEIHKEIEAYIVTKTLISFMTGGLVAFTLALLDIPFALLFGLMAFTLNYIPNVGWVIASVPPLLVAGVHFDSIEAVVQTGLLLLAIHGTLGFLDPLITGKRLHLNPTTVLVSLVIWAWLWGAWGMVLAVPIAAVIRIVTEHTGFMRSIGTLMSDRN